MDSVKIFGTYQFFFLTCCWRCCHTSPWGALWPHPMSPLLLDRRPLLLPLMERKKKKERGGGRSKPRPAETKIQNERLYRLDLFVGVTVIRSLSKNVSVTHSVRSLFMFYHFLSAPEWNPNQFVLFFLFFLVVQSIGWLISSFWGLLAAAAASKSFHPLWAKPVD